MNLHTHTWRCRHAAGDVADYCLAAQAQGLTVLGMSDRAALPDDRWLNVRMSYGQLGEYSRAGGAAQVPVAAVLGAGGGVRGAGRGEFGRAPAGGRGRQPGGGEDAGGGLRAGGAGGGVGRGAAEWDPIVYLRFDVLRLALDAGLRSRLCDLPLLVLRRSLYRYLFFWFFSFFAWLAWRLDPQIAQITQMTDYANDED